ncbi:MAG: histidine phosphatase family protein [Alphaproteobacteria bacterium]|nr:histidine phosphatase family protein [Alphaproteobacteria bacterium]
MKVYVVRHGEAEGNQEGRYLGHIDSPLTEVGRQQALRQSEVLKGLGIARILSSDLMRARATASIIADAMGLPVLSTSALREANHGVIDGCLASDIRKSEYGRARKKDKYNYRPPGGESCADIEARVLSVLMPPPDQTSLLVTHLGPMRVMLHRLGGLSQGDAVGAKIGHEAILALTSTGASWSGTFLNGSPGR